MGLPMIRLSDSELTAVMAAARPIDVSRRDAFLQRVADELGRCNQLGPGCRTPRVRFGAARVFRPAGFVGGCA